MVEESTLQIVEYLYGPFIYFVKRVAWANDKQYNKIHTDFCIQVISMLTAETISLDDSTLSNQSTEAFKGLNGRHFPNKIPVPNTKNTFSKHAKYVPLQNVNVIAVEICQSVNNFAKNLALNVQLAGFHYVLTFVLRYTQKNYIQYYIDKYLK